MLSASATSENYPTEYVITNWYHMPRRAPQRPEGEDSSLALDTRSRAVIQQLVDEKRAALEAAAPHIPLEEYLHGGQDSLQSSIKRMRDAAASFASA